RDFTQAHALLGQGSVLVCPVALELDGKREGFMRVLLPEGSARALAAREISDRRLAPALSTLPIALCAHAARVVLSRVALDSLAPGDVVVPERSRLARDP